MPERRMGVIGNGRSPKCAARSNRDKRMKYKMRLFKSGCFWVSAFLFIIMRTLAAACVFAHSRQPALIRFLHSFKQDFPSAFWNFRSGFTSLFCSPSVMQASGMAAGKKGYA